VGNDPLDKTDASGQCPLCLVVLYEACEAAFAAWRAYKAVAFVASAAGAAAVAHDAIQNSSTSTPVTPQQSSSTALPAGTSLPTSTSTPMDAQQSSSTSSPAQVQGPDVMTSTGNTNPYSGPVNSPVTVVDSNGNAIPVGAGQQITASPNGDYQQVRDANGSPTGVRLDRGGHAGQSDPAAQGPHAHVPGVTNNGNPHLPINCPGTGCTQ